LPDGLINRAADNWRPLLAIEGRQWAEWKAGEPITTNGLARLLAPFGISRARSARSTARPKVIRSRNLMTLLRDISPEKIFEPPPPQHRRHEHFLRSSNRHQLFYVAA